MSLLSGRSLGLVPAVSGRPVRGLGQAWVFSPSEEREYVQSVLTTAIYAQEMHQTRINDAVDAVERAGADVGAKRAALNDAIVSIQDLRKAFWQQALADARGAGVGLPVPGELAVVPPPLTEVVIRSVWQDLADTERVFQRAHDQANLAIDIRRAVNVSDLERILDQAGRTFGPAFSQARLDLAAILKAVKELIEEKVPSGTLTGTALIVGALSVGAVAVLALFLYIGEGPKRRPSPPPPPRKGAPEPKTSPWAVRLRKEK